MFPVCSYSWGMTLLLRKSSAQARIEGWDPRIWPDDGVVVVRPNARVPAFDAGLGARFAEEQGHAPGIRTDREHNQGAAPGTFRHRVLPWCRLWFWIVLWRARSATGLAPKALWESAVHCRQAKAPSPGGNTPMAEHRETVSPQTAKDLLRDSERQLRLVTDNVHAAIAHCDTEARYKFVNRHYAERLGLTAEQIIGKRIPEVLGEKAYAAIDRYVGECLAGNAVEFEVEVPYQVGEPQFMHCCYEPESKEGKVVGLVAAITIITGLKRAEERLRASEITFRQLVENSPFGIFTVDADFRIMQVSAGAQRKMGNVRPLIGRDLAEVLGGIWPEPFASDAIGGFRHTLDTGEPFHAPGSVQRRKDTDVVESYDWKIERLTMPDGRFS